MAWRGGRVVEGARLEIVYAATYRGFESPPLRHVMRPPNGVVLRSGVEATENPIFCVAKGVRWSE